MSNKGHALAREEMVRTLTAYSGTTTSAGAEDGSSLIDSRLIDKNDFLTGKSVLILSGDAKWETAGITFFEKTTGELSLSPAMSTRIVAGVAFRVLNTLPESLHITSGIVQIQGYDYESGEYRLVAVNVSGQIEIKATVADIVTAKISGQTVEVRSGIVAVSSGTVIAKVSGTVAIKSGIFVVSSGTVVVASGVVAISSGTVIAKVSGQTVEVRSGVVAVSSGTVVVASGVVAISSGVVVAKISGQVVQPIVPTMLKTGPVRTLPSGSGGVVLHSGAIKAAVVKALSNNSGIILVGGSGDRPWYESVGSAQGLILAAGEAQIKNVNNFNAIYVVAQVSGDKVCFEGVY